VATRQAKSWDRVRTLAGSVQVVSGFIAA